MPLPCFFLEAIVLHLMFWPMIYFEERNLMKSVSSVCELRALFDYCFEVTCVYHLSQNRLLKELSLLLLLPLFLGRLLNNYVFVGPLLDSRFCSNDLFLFLLIPYSPGYYNFAINLRISICPLSLFFFSVRLTALGSFTFLESVCWNCIVCKSSSEKLRL